MPRWGARSRNLCLLVACAASTSCIASAASTDTAGEQGDDAHTRRSLFPSLFGKGSAATDEAFPSSFVFFGIADWGGQENAPYTTPGQLEVAEVMGVVAEEGGNHPAFVIAAGDNFYMDGLPGPADSNATISRFTATYEEVYTAPGIQVPWYVVGGNHDWVGNISAEMALTGSTLSGGKWFFPELYYTFTVEISAGGDTIQFVMIDTETLTGGQNQQPGQMPNLFYPPGPAGGRKILQNTMNWQNDPPIPSNWQPPPVNEAQWEWINTTLYESTADWIFVVGHHPVWSAGQYGPTWDLVERLLPIMEGAGVALYINGHEHMMEHFRPMPHNSSVDFVVIGNGAYWNDTSPDDSLHLQDCPYSSLQFQYDSGTGFAMFKVNPAAHGVPTQVSVTYIAGNGTQMYSFYKENPRTMPGFTAGNLRAPPAPTAQQASMAAHHAFSAATGPTARHSGLKLIGLGILALAVFACLAGLSSVVESQEMARRAAMLAKVDVSKLPPLARQEIAMTQSRLAGGGGIGRSASGGESAPLLRQPQTGAKHM